MSMVEIEFFSPKVLADRWSRSEQYIYDLVAARKLKRTPWGRMVQIHRSEVERFEKERLQCVHLETTATTSERTEESSAPSSMSADGGKAALRLGRITRAKQSG